MVHTTSGQGAGWRIVAGFCPLIAGPLRRLLNCEIWFLWMMHHGDTKKTKPFENTSVAI